MSSGHFAGEQATEQAYAILGAAADYVNDLDQYESLLNRAVAFFDSARSVSIDLLHLFHFVFVLFLSFARKKVKIHRENNLFTRRVIFAVLTHRVCSLLVIIYSCRVFRLFYYENIRGENEDVDP